VRTAAAPASSTTLGVSPSVSHAVAIPTIGTSSVNGATVLAGWRPSSQAHAPKPANVETPEAVAMLVARDVDLILGMECSHAPRRDDTRFHREELLGDALDAVLPADHAPATRSRIDLSELSDEGWVGPPIGWSCDEVFVAGCRTAGFSPKVAHRSGDWQAVMALVAGGLGVSLVPRLAHTAPPAGVVIIPLTGVPPKRHVFVACRAGAQSSPAIGVVLQVLADSARRQSPLVRAA
jgi:DNA-binding transcriptional LysR family regulator